MTRTIRSALVLAALGVAGCGPQAPSPVIGGGTPMSPGGSTSPVTRDTDSAAYPAPLPQGNISTTRTQAVRP